MEGSYIGEKKEYAENYYTRRNTAALDLSSKVNKCCLCFTHHSYWFSTTFRTATKGFCRGLYSLKVLKKLNLFHVSPCIIL